MKSIHPIWNWVLLLLLGLSSYMVEWGFGFAFPFIYTASNATPGSPPPYTPIGYPWTAGLVFCALTAIIFFFCLRDSHQRRAAFTAFGISALLTGPFYVWNADRLAQVLPVASPWMAPHLPFALTALCWILGIGLGLWWLFRSIPVTRQGPAALFLFEGLLFVLLIMPVLSNRCGIESLGFFMQLPMNADVVQNDQAALTHLLVYGFAGTLDDMITFMVQWIGLLGSIIALPILAYALRPGRLSPEQDPNSASSFPGRSDFFPILCLVVGGLLYACIPSTMDGLIQQINGVSGTVQRPGYPCKAGIFSVEVLVELVFLAGAWLILRRIRTASQLRFGFTLLILIVSLMLSMMSIVVPPHWMKVGGVLALILCVAQFVMFFEPKHRGLWVRSVFTAPSETFLAFAVKGSVMLAVLAGAFVAIALELAMVSVMTIGYLIAWGNALKLPHGVAPTEKLAPAFAPSLAAINVDLGPVYFSACLFFGVMLVIIFSLVYSGCQGLAKLYRYVKSIKQPAASAA